MFLDPLAITFPDPDHSTEERREITIGHTMKEHLVFVSHCERLVRSGLSARGWPLGQSVNNMKKQLAKTSSGALREEYDLSDLKGGVRGKYYQQAKAGTNLVLIESDLSNLFPDSKSVNRALRLLAETAQMAAKPKRRSRA